MIPLPAISTVHTVLDRNGMTKQKSRHYKPQRTNLCDVSNPNQLWCVDYKRQFRIVSWI